MQSLLIFAEVSEAINATPSTTDKTYILSLNLRIYLFRDTWLYFLEKQMGKLIFVNSLEAIPKRIHPNPAVVVITGEQILWNNIIRRARSEGWFPLTSAVGSGNDESPCFENLVGDIRVVRKWFVGGEHGYCSQGRCMNITTPGSK